MKTKIPVWKTIRFTFSNLTKNSWMYLRNSLFLQLFISVFGFGLLSKLSQAWGSFGMKAIELPGLDVKGDNVQHDNA